MRVVAYVPDLMDRSKFDVLPPEIEVVFVSAPTALADGGAHLVVADLGRSGVLDALGEVEVSKVGFISHVDEETRAKAVSLGIHVFARSAFFSRLMTIITSRV